MSKTTMLHQIKQRLASASNGRQASALLDHDRKQLAAWSAIALAVTVMAGFPTQSKADSDPKTMLKVVTRLTEPKLDPSDFSAQPKTLYRAGTQYLRAEEGQNPKYNIKQLFIFAKPDLWSIELNQKVAEHQREKVSAGGGAHCPMLPVPKTDWMHGLEFGNEIEWMKKNGAKETNNFNVGTLDLKKEGGEIILTYDNKTQKPQTIMIEREGQRRKMEYTAYDELPFDHSLFQPPKDVKVSEAGTLKNHRIAGVGPNGRPATAQSSEAVK